MSSLSSHCFVHQGWRGSRELLSSLLIKSSALCSCILHSVWWRRPERISSEHERTLLFFSDEWSSSARLGICPPPPPPYSSFSTEAATADTCHIAGMQLGSSRKNKIVSKKCRISQRIFTHALLGCKSDRAFAVMENVSPPYFLKDTPTPTPAVSRRLPGWEDDGAFILWLSWSTWSHCTHGKFCLVCFKAGLM